MTPGRAALVRLTIVCAAWALGEALAWQLGSGSIGALVGAILASAAYVATRGGGLGRFGDPEATYWRGRRIDRDRWH